MNFYKLSSLAKAPQIARVVDIEVKKRICEALHLSHIHQSAKRLRTTFPKKKTEAKINKDSSVYFHFDKKDLENKTIIYDELVKVSGSWEYSVVTIV